MAELQLFDYQATAADVMSERKRFGLHDEMGIGKTATTIGAINRTWSNRGIIVCPGMLRQNWIREFRRFSEYDLRVVSGKNIHDYVAWQRGHFDVLVTSYELATKWTPKFKSEGEYIDFVAFDEAHYLKNHNANRTRALLGLEASGMDSLVEHAEYAWHVTGTPMANDPLDVYTFLRFAKALDMPPDTFVDYFFQKRLTSFGSRHSVKPEMRDTLAALIYNNAIRRTHTEVGLELPPIFLKEQLIEGDTSDLMRLASEYPGLEDIIIYAIEAGDLGLIDAPYIATLRRLIGKAKVMPYAKQLKSDLDAGAGKRVVFCWHTEPLQYLQKFLEKSGYSTAVVYGQMNDKARNAAVDRFMNDPNCLVFIGNIKVAGVGLTLTESSEIDILESDWTPAGNAQALKRVHRIGQTQRVEGRFITLSNSIDEVVNKVVAGKTRAIAEIEGHTMNAAPLDVLQA